MLSGQTLHVSAEAIAENPAFSLGYCSAGSRSGDPAATRKAVKEVVKVLPATVDELNKKVDGFKSKIENIQVTAPAPELLPVHNIIADGFTTIKIGSKAAYRPVH